MSDVEANPGSGRLRADKRAAILRAARAEFARCGFPGASVERIAAQAGVSTRTLYKHFGSKDALFAQTLVGSAREVAETFLTELPDRGEEAGPEAEIGALVAAILAQRTRFPEHFAIVRRVEAERERIPADLLEAWLEAGPNTVREEIERRLQDIARRGGLEIGDPDVAARHLAALSLAEVLDPVAAGGSTGDVAAATRAFLHGYAAHTGNAGR